MLLVMPTYFFRVEVSASFPVRELTEGTRKPFGAISSASQVASALIAASAR